MTALTPDVLDGFTRLKPRPDLGDAAYEVVSVARCDAKLLEIGAVLEVDQNRRLLQNGFLAFALSEVLLAGVDIEGRPKDGPRKVILRTSGEGKPIVLSYAEATAAVIGRPRIPTPPDLDLGPDDREMTEVARRFQVEKAEERRQNDARAHAARLAGWRVKPVKSKLPPWAVLPYHGSWRGPSGKTRLDAVVDRLLQLGRVRYEHIEHSGDMSVHETARIQVFSYAYAAIEQAQKLADQGPQAKKDASKVGTKLDALSKELAAFLEYVDERDAGLFSGAQSAPRTDIECAIAHARERVAAADQALNVLRASMSRGRYEHDGAKDVLASEFLCSMRMPWYIVTGERARGRTGNGLFHDFCRAAWLSLGWPDQADDYFSRRIERGVHLRHLD